MSANSKISWTDSTWNITTGCMKCSLGCEHCYAERMAKRLRGRCGYPADDPFRVTLHPDRLDDPRRWRKPRRVFVSSMGDLFHHDVPDEFIERIWRRMIEARRHTFLVLTKRPERMAKFVDQSRTPPESMEHIWLGTSIETQEYVAQRLPPLLECQANRFVSCEPLLSPLEFNLWGIHWVIVGCESRGRYVGRLWIGRASADLDMDHHGNWCDWAQTIVDHCDDARVPAFVKQVPCNGLVCKDLKDFPLGLRCQETPTAWSRKQ